MAEVTEKIDQAINHALAAKHAALDFNYAVAAEEYDLAATILKDVLYSGKITDEDSAHLLRVKCDNFKNQHKLNRKKAIETGALKPEASGDGKTGDASLDSLVSRFQKLKAEPKPVSSVSDLQSRLDKLVGDKKPAASREELEARLKALGPSQFEDNKEKDEEREMLENLIEQARADEADNAQRKDIELDLSDPMQKKIDEMFKSVEEVFNIQTSGLSSQTTTNNSAVLNLMQEAADLAKFSDPSPSKQSDLLEMEEVSSSEESESDSSLSESSSDSDSPRKRRQRRRNKKKKKKKKKKKSY